MKRVAVKEFVVEDYFVSEVENAGGRADKFVTPGRRGPPDRLVTWPRNGWAKLELVELKTTGGALSPQQKLDHAARARLGCVVRVIWTKAQVDEYIRYELGGRRPVQSSIGCGHKVASCFCDPPDRLVL